MKPAKLAFLAVVAMLAATQVLSWLCLSPREIRCQGAPIPSNVFVCDPVDTWQSGTTNPGSRVLVVPSEATQRVSVAAVCMDGDGAFAQLAYEASTSALVFVPSQVGYERPDCRLLRIVVRVEPKLTGLGIRIFTPGK